MAAADAAGATSAGGALAMTFTAGASAGVPRILGPGLVVGMNEADVVDRLNAWGIARDGDLQDVTAEVAPHQPAVGAVASSDAADDDAHV